MDSLLGGRGALGGHEAAQVRVGDHRRRDVAGRGHVGGELAEVLPGVFDVVEVQEAGDGVQPVGVFVGLGSQPVGERSHRVELPDHLVVLGAVPQGEYDAEITPPALDGLAGDDERSVTGDGEHALHVLAAFDDVTKPWREVGVGDRGARGEVLSEQHVGGVVAHGDPPRAIHTQHAVLYAVDDRFALTQQVGELPWLESEGLLLEATGEGERPGAADEQGETEERGRAEPQCSFLVADRLGVDARAHLADDPTAGVAERDLAAG